MCWVISWSSDLQIDRWRKLVVPTLIFNLCQHWTPSIIGFIFLSDIWQIPYMLLKSCFWILLCLVVRDGLVFLLGGMCLKVKYKTYWCEADLITWKPSTKKLLLFLLMRVQFQVNFQGNDHQFLQPLMLFFVCFFFFFGLFCFVFFTQNVRLIHSLCKWACLDEF